MKKLFMLLITIIVTLVNIGCNSDDAIITEIKSQDFYEVNFQDSSRTIEHSIELKKDCNVNVEIEKDSGKLLVKVQDYKGKIVYEGNGSLSSDFSFKVNDNGVYKFFIETKKATGKIIFNL